MALQDRSNRADVYDLLNLILSRGGELPLEGEELPEELEAAICICQDEPAWVELVPSPSVLWLRITLQGISAHDRWVPEITPEQAIPVPKQEARATGKGEPMRAAASSKKPTGPGAPPTPGPSETPLAEINPFFVHDPKTYKLLESRLSVPAANPVVPLTNPVPVWLGKGKVQIGDKSLALEARFSDVLETLVQLGAATQAQLSNRSGREEPGRLLKKLVERFPDLEPHITFPGKRGQGGYRTVIKDGTKENKENKENK